MGFLINRIYNEDCLQGMYKIPDKKIDCVITSPPYNIVRSGLSDRGYDEYSDGITNEQYSNWCCQIFRVFDRILKQNGCVLWNMSYGSENTECMPLTVSDIIRNTNFTLADIIVWKKNAAFPNNMSSNKLTRICEFVYVFCRKDEFLSFKTNKKQVSERKTGQAAFENVFNFIEAPNNDGSTDLNKATFSTNFASKLLKMYVKPFELVLDCFMGTGTTAISCIDNNVNFIGFEISKKQCDYANDRIKTRLANFSMFDQVDYVEEKMI